MRNVDLAALRASTRFAKMVPHALVGKQVELSAVGGEVVIVHDGGEVARHPLVALGEVAEQYLRAAAAAGTQRLASELEAIVALEHAYGRDALLAGLKRLLAFYRFRASDVRAILEAGHAPPRPRPAGGPLMLDLPQVEQRPLAAYALVAPLAPDLEQGLKRLKLRRMRQLAPELLQTATTQRWLPEELLRTLVEAEIAARDETNLHSRLRAAGFPQPTRLDDFQLAASSIPRASFDYLASLEWIRSADNACLIGPPGTGKSHVLIGCGLAAVEAGLRVRYLRADELVEHLYRGLADNSVGKQIDTLLRFDLVLIDEIGFAPLDDTGAQPALPLRRRRLRTTQPRRRQPLAVRGMGPLPARARHRRRPARPAPPPRHRRRHHRRVIPHEGSQNQRRRQPEPPLTPINHPGRPAARPLLLPLRLRLSPRAAAAPKPRRAVGTSAGHQQGLREWSIAVVAALAAVALAAPVVSFAGGSGGPNDGHGQIGPGVPVTPAQAYAGFTAPGVVPGDGAHEQLLRFDRSAAELELPGDDLAGAAVDRRHQVAPAVLGHPHAVRSSRHSPAGPLGRRRESPLADRRKLRKERRVAALIRGRRSRSVPVCGGVR